jgi:DNA-binding MarR family transcriptional regulator
MNLSAENRRIWLWLCAKGGKWTARELAQRIGGDSQAIFRCLHAMARRQLIAQYPPEDGSRYKRYAVTDTCLVPLGLSVAEVRA